METKRRKAAAQEYWEESVAKPPAVSAAYIFWVSAAWEPGRPMGAGACLRAGPGMIDSGLLLPSQLQDWKNCLHASASDVKLQQKVVFISRFTTTVVAVSCRQARLNPS